MGKRLILVFSLFLGAGSTYAKEFILCKHSSASNVVVTLSDFKKFGRVFDCIDGEFVSDLSGCAPDGAFGLHAPTGSAALVEVVDRWQDYAEHMGGITSHFVTSKGMSFAGGFNSPTVGYKEDWRFSISRLTGIGTLEQAAAPPRKYACAKAARKF